VVVRDRENYSPNKKDVEMIENNDRSWNQGCQNRDFILGRKEITKSGLVKSQSKSKDFI